MSKIRRNFSKEFKSKVVLEALKERNTLEALATTYIKKVKGVAEHRIAKSPKPPLGASASQGFLLFGIMFWVLVFFSVVLYSVVIV